MRTVLDQRSKWSLMIGAGILFLASGAILALVGAGFSPAAVVCLVLGLPTSTFGLAMMFSRSGEDARQALSLEDQVEALTQEAFRQRDAVDQFASGLDMMILVVDSKHRLIYANSQARNGFGMDQAFGQSLLTRTFSRELEDMVARAFDSGEPLRGELNFTHPEERTGQVQVWAEPPLYSRCFISIVDITSLRRLERSRQDFVANVSHELRTPMATIRVMAETLQEERDDPDIQDRFLKAIIHEVDRLAAVTSELLTLSIVESTGLTKAPVHLVDCMEKALQRLSTKAEERGIALTASAECVPVLNLNASLIQQVFHNLVDNAINYTAQGSVHLQVEENDSEVILKVSDTGIGIASEHLPRLFERFYRVDKGRSRAKGGTGLGLSIVKHIVEAHGGRVWVESILGEGSTFFMSLPKEIAEAESDSLDSSER